MSDYSSQTVAQLKELLKQRGLSTEGKKADLVTRLIDSDNSQVTAAAQEEAPLQTEGSTTDAANEVSIEAPTEASAQPIDSKVAANESTASSAAPGSEPTLTVIQPQPKTTQVAEGEAGADLKENNKESEPPKQLTAEERKQLAVELLQKKIARAEKYGDEKLAEESRKSLNRVEKFGVELGTSLAREIGLVDDKLGSGNGFKKHHGRRGKFNRGRGIRKNRGGRR